MSKRILVIGGVAAGASAAARARRTSEDVEITLVESGPYMSFANCGLPYYVGGEIAERSSLFVANPRQFAARFQVDVRLSTEATAVDTAARTVSVRTPEGATESLAYDRLVITTGTDPIIPPVPGLDGPNVYLCRTVPDVDAIMERLEAMSRTELEGIRDSSLDWNPQSSQYAGLRALVIGGGYIGLEVAEQLLHRGIGVTLVEAADQLMGPLDPEVAGPVEEAMREAGARVLVGDAVAALEHTSNDRIIARMSSGAECRVDLVVLGAGVRPNVALAEAAGIALGPTGAIAVDKHQRTSDPAVFAAGDNCEAVFAPTGQPVNIPLAGPANKMGRVAGDNAAWDLVGAPGDDPQRLRMPAVLGTGIVRAAGVVAGGTGLSEKWARREGIPVSTTYLVSTDHAGYYPNASRLGLKVLYDPATGRLLGGQAVGRNGVDKRLDIIATAITGGMTVHDLEDLDLCYAPPFGAAKDPVIMTGFISGNAARGTAPGITPGELAAELSSGNGEAPFILDVRSRREYANGRLAGSLNIPLEKVRERMDEVPRDRLVVSQCAGGYRSYVAQQILRNHGYDNVRNLYGGFGLAVRVPELAALVESDD